MKKKQKSKKFFQVARRPIVIIVLLFTITQAISIYYIYQNREYMKLDSERSVSGFINETEEKRYSHPVIDITEKRVYIPEARIYLPLNDTTRHLRYQYNDAFDKPQLYLSMRGVVGNQRESEPATCDKMITFSSQMSTDSDRAFEIEQTKDGFRFIYKHPNCDIYYETVSDDLFESAKQVKNY